MMPTPFQPTPVPGTIPPIPANVVPAKPSTATQLAADIQPLVTEVVTDPVAVAENFHADITEAHKPNVLKRYLQTVVSNALHAVAVPLVPLISGDATNLLHLNWHQIGNVSLVSLAGSLALSLVSTPFGDQGTAVLAE